MSVNSYVPEWADPLITGRNRVLTHSPLASYPNVESARGSKPSSSASIMSLNGNWQFKLSDSPDHMPQGFLKVDERGRDWLEMPVPSNWQLHPEVKDQPIYTNMNYPFKKTPPAPPELNPTGWYRTEIVVPKDWDGRRLFLVFESCDSACKVWLNGEEVAYSQDSKLPHEFEITAYAEPGRNTLAVMVPRYCDGFWLECQDYWHLSGIQRDVYLLSKPQNYLRDFQVQTLLDDACERADLSISAYMNEAPDLARGYWVRAMLFDPDGKPAIQTFVEGKVSLSSPMYGDRTAEFTAAKISIPVKSPLLWTAETPHLYTLVLSLIAPGGKAVDHESCKVGFRRLEIKDQQLLLNGRRLVIRGVNAHEHHPDKGRALSESDMRNELIAMKRLNFNAVRTSHYPHHTVFYDLCDELGMYVVDEANLETHGIGALASKDPLWMNAYMERAQRMALRDKNHACVIAWSLGNESYHGPHHAAMAGWLRAFDPTRPVQYESGFPGAAVSDIMCPMYPQLDWVVKTLADASEKRPMIMCEYAYAKGNAGGNVHKFWEMVDEWPSFQGGFVWDWCDKALMREVDGQREYAYGNEFDDGIGPDGYDYGEFENPQMCLNGVVLPDLTPKPGAVELMKVQAPIAFKRPADAKRMADGEVEIINKHHTKTLAEFGIVWELNENGKTIDEGAVKAPDLKPGESGIVTLDLKLPQRLRFGGEYWLNVAASQLEETPWSQEGHVVAWEQFSMPLTIPGLRPVRPPPETIRLEARDGMLWMTTGELDVGINTRLGMMTRFSVAGEQLLTSPLEHSFMRAPTDNDYMLDHEGNYFAEWLNAGLDRLETVVVSCDGALLGEGQAVVRCVTRHYAKGVDAGITCESTYTMLSFGEVMVENRVVMDSAMPCVPRIGMKASFVPELEQLMWYGRGPHENYVDRKASALVGIYESTVRDQFIPFIDPGECGGHEDTRWLQLHDGQGIGVFFCAEPLLHFSALHYTIDDLTQARHVYSLNPTRDVQLNLDGFHMGLGGDTGWTRNVHPEYLLPAGTYRYGFRMSPS